MLAELTDQVGNHPARHLVSQHSRVDADEAAFELPVLLAHVLEVGRERLQRLEVHARVVLGPLGEAGDEGAQLERELVRCADELGMVLAGPNGQGIVSTAVSMCAQIAAPYPPPGDWGERSAGHPSTAATG